MKQYKILMFIALSTISYSLFAQEAQQDSAVNKIKIKELTLKKQAIEKKIAIEDKKRNAVINGVTAETQEVLNDKQDSICLELRSQLVDIKLELKELIPDKSSKTIAEQYNNLNKKQKGKKEE
ncbi:MAG: hypothetical protein IJE42_08785 [Bacteroidaceae bacterium]|nr:hypothetical protein [Bacteroidaceae bacterium]